MLLSIVLTISVLINSSYQAKDATFSVVKEVTSQSLDKQVYDALLSSYPYDFQTKLDQLVRVFEEYIEGPNKVARLYLPEALEKAKLFQEIALTVQYALQKAIDSIKQMDDETKTAQDWTSIYDLLVNINKNTETTYKKVMERVDKIERIISDDKNKDKNIIRTDVKDMVSGMTALKNLNTLIDDVEYAFDMLKKLMKKFN